MNAIAGISSSTIWRTPVAIVERRPAMSRRDAKALSAFLDGFARLEVKNKRIVVHDGVDRCGVGAPSAPTLLRPEQTRAPLLSKSYGGLLGRRAVRDGMLHTDVRADRCGDAGTGAMVERFDLSEGG